MFATQMRRPFLLTCALAGLCIIGSPGAASQEIGLLGLDDPTAEESQLILEGFEARQAGEFALAREKYRQLLTLRPDHPIVLYELALAYGEEGRADECVTYAARSASQESFIRSQAFQIQGICHAMAEQYDDALTAFDAANEADPRMMEPYQHAAAIHTQRGDLNAAAERLLASIEIQPDHYPSHVRLAEIRLRQGRRAAGLLGLAFFLEDSPAAAAVFRRVLNPETDTYPTAGRDQRLAGLEDAITNGLERRAAEPGRHELEHIVAQFEAILASLPEPGEAADESDPVWSLYIPFFRDLRDAGHAETYIHYSLHEAPELFGVRSWVARNREGKIKEYLIWTVNRVLGL